MRYERADLEGRVLLHTGPALLVDSVDADPETGVATGTFLVSADHPGLEGHFEGKPIWKGVHVLEGLNQVAGVLWRELLAKWGEPPEIAKLGFLVGYNGEIRFRAVVRPGQTIWYGVTATTKARRRKPIAVFAAEARLDGPEGPVVCEGAEIVLGKVKTTS